MNIPLYDDSAWFSESDCDLEALRALVEQPVAPSEYPHADGVVDGAVVYGEKHDLGSPELCRSARVKAELGRALSLGPGVVVVRGAFDHAVIDRASDVFFTLIDREKQEEGHSGDHFGAPGANDRLWSALEKLALTAPDVFFDYYSNEVVALVSLAWLGPHYQIVSEINCVNPGSPAQTGHRDYHLGMYDLGGASAFPVPVHRFSSALTLQVAVVHTDMPTATGPTMYLPHSQKFEPGFLAVNLPEFQDYFASHRKQIPLEKGDVLIFNPAVVHAAGANTTDDERRLANLLQISSAFGRPVASVHRASILRAIYPSLQKGRVSDLGSTETVIAAAADGYSFPTNMDLDRPGFTSRVSESQADLTRRALSEGWTIDAFEAALREQRVRRLSSLDREGW